MLSGSQACCPAGTHAVREPSLLSARARMLSGSQPCCPGGLYAVRQACMLSARVCMLSARRSCCPNATHAVRATRMLSASTNVLSKRRACCPFALPSCRAGARSAEQTRVRRRSGGKCPFFLLLRPPLLPSSWRAGAHSPFAHDARHHRAPRSASAPSVRRPRAPPPSPRERRPSPPVGAGADARRGSHVAHGRRRTASRATDAIGSATTRTPCWSPSALRVRRSSAA